MTDDLVAAGHISFEQAEVAEGKDAGPASPVRLAEALGYFGSIGVFIATVALMTKVALDDFNLLGGIDNVPGGFVMLAGAVLLLGAGYQMTGVSEPATKRSGGFVLASGFGLWSIAVGLLLLDLDINDFTPLVLSIPVLAAAIWVWRRHHSVPTQLVLFAAIVQLINALMVLVQIVAYATPQETIARVVLTNSPPGTAWFAHVVGVLLGVTWIWLAGERAVTPRNTGFAVGSLYAGLHAMALFASADGWIVLFAGLTTLVLYEGAAWRSSVLLGVGAVGIGAFILMLMTIFVDAPSATDFALWFGIPGVLALTYATYSVASESAAEG